MAQAAHGTETTSRESQPPVLSVKDLFVDFRVSAGLVKAVRGVSFDLYANESLALIGESGCGKTTLGLALLRLLPRLAQAEGRITYRRRGGQVVDILTMADDDLREFRWQECAMVFQGALNSLNPVLKVWDHMLDTVRAHQSWSRQRVRQRAEELLRMVQLDPNRVLAAYPHQLSGGMRQRVMIALSLLLEPQVVILDEPTTALDILTQRAIIDVLHELHRKLDFAMIFVSHDLPLAAELADRVATMYAGKIVELGSTRDIFYGPRHPYSLGLIKAVPPVMGELFEMTSLAGSPPSLLNLPQGCTYHPRCPYARERCREVPADGQPAGSQASVMVEAGDPPLYQVGSGHEAACHYWEEVELKREVLADA